MKPLNKEEITKFLERFDDFKESEIRSLKIISPMEIELQFAVQDKARAFDWITVDMNFFGVTDARMVENKNLDYLVTDNGVTLINDNDTFAFALGHYQNTTALKDAQLYIISKSIKYNEGAF